ncbi:hypothetical protein MFMK1_002504 [Metallumcola ferriviriculae]|uniref:Uncharacterized protein n=1 Tax=Metallumcola ferriviriculae TaxID=3039180 RepID=A0AAU0UR16_9FIRM|nr:hypothetical protein MFMK1_002504 [Desulfitibacteraceae bacterium MK1]
MWMLPVILMILAGVFGFSLVIYYFLYETKLELKWRWLGGVVGGSVSAVVCAIASFILLWPPRSNAVLLLVGFVVVGQVYTFIDPKKLRDEQNDNKGEVV